MTLDQYKNEPDALPAAGHARTVENPRAVLKEVAARLSALEAEHAKLKAELEALKQKVG